MVLKPASAREKLPSAKADSNLTIAVTRAWKARTTLQQKLNRYSRCPQNENSICRSMRRLAEPEENGGPASAFAVPKSGESRLPTGGA